ncbi:MAG: hypothetical protein QGI89_03040 [Candidatus Woesearchaeota archaeon]|jgi:hypothetical protein|nr:hypothetical protein [Candidatus Woesearchaeota archaeon]MDP6265354.1 hypothetical protein [Candidatus Woesearchaeota archaeon]MDP7323119.1 hypothetical protein [Candidatus Woesearchaeota archaeon]HJO01851.1 hypothetical protein [Candidatus Woesearchaeota archaeon]|tara:strand:- start:1570 stop:1716 length:147 start_codon:yes stop_codon:yes gene_type:complete
MKLDELASLMGKTKDELIEQLKQTDVIELRLTEKADKEIKDNGSMEII